MNGNPTDASLLTFDGGPTAMVEFASTDDAQILRQLLESRAGQPLSITLAVPAEAEADVEGHAQSPSLALTLHADADDTAGHAINVHFPTATDAARFRRNMILTGALAGSIVLGSAGVMIISSQASAPADNGSLVRTPVYERPAGHGMLEGTDPIPSVSTVPAAAAVSAIGASSLIDPATGRPADRGFLEGADGAPAETAGGSANRPTGAGPLEGVDE